ncbi:sensor histidine kinase [Nocardioides mesophilus]|uniref:histidine kinase n=1 Tax=Nocardioides mesophilus TaxID=433659 RepID=A0A7G9R795_9ACTN|nr:HAMP domain-containing sensor histidine kinase [Nocardioides mesophilus]QNN51470.1 HAMP domain-containing histidine kinase [Nocardioides mesophilus]
MTPWQRLVGGRPIVTRLVVTVVLSMAVVLAVVSTFIYSRVAFALDRQLESDLGTVSDAAVARVERGDAPPPAAHDEVWQTYTTTGRLLDSSNGSSAPVVGAAAVRGLGAAPAELDVGTFLPVPDRAYRLRLTRVSTPEGERVLAVGLDRSRHDEALRELLLQLVLGGALTLVAAAVVGYRTARAALRPVHDYRVAVDSMHEDPGGRLPVDEERGDELTRLGHTFNGLLAQIEAAQLRERSFLADASHELRTPLSLLAAEIEWARHRPRSPAEVAEVLESLQSQVGRLVELSNALLDLEELRSGAAVAVPEEMDLRRWLHEVVGRFERTADGQGRRLRVDAPAAVVRVDRRWLEMAVTNLVSNALRHGEGAVSVIASLHDGLLRLEVHDEGAGFPDSVRHRAFDRFARADESRSTRGSGLGLSLVRAVAETLGGSVRIEDPGTAATAGGGATVVLEVPVAGVAEVAAPPVVVRGSAPATAPDQPG